MTTIVNIVVPILGSIFIAAAIISFLSGIRARSTSSHSAYGWGRQEARQIMQVAFLRSFGLLIIGLIILGVYGLSLLPEDITMPDPLPTPTATTIEQIPVTLPATIATTANATLAAPVIIPSVTPMPLLPTETATSVVVTVEPSPTVTVVPSAVVNSPVGLYLREAPGGIQEIELLINGTVLTLLPGRESVDGTEWQQVRTPAGNEGWVAVQFIIYQ